MSTSLPGPPDALNAVKPEEASSPVGTTMSFVTRSLPSSRETLTLTNDPETGHVALCPSAATAHLPPGEVRVAVGSLTLTVSPDRVNVGVFVSPSAAT